MATVQKIEKLEKNKTKTKPCSFGKVVQWSWRGKRLISVHVPSSLIIIYLEAKHSSKL